ncbi:MAG: hypothetical protein ACK5XN_40020 [Bacteroidota bacterium]
MAVKKARDKKRALQLILKDADAQLTEYEIKFAHGNLGFFMSAYNRHLLMDSDLTESDAFNLAITDIVFEITQEDIEQLAEYEALSFQKEYILEITTPTTITKQQPAELPSLIWQGQETELIQLIYALIEAKRLPEKGKIKIVETIANCLGFELSTNWKSNLSKSISERNSDYQPAIFKDLEEGWNSYVESRDKK